MKFIELHCAGRKTLVNMDTVTDICQKHGSNMSTLHFNLNVDGDQMSFNVDESLDEIYEKVKRSENE